MFSPVPLQGSSTGDAPVQSARASSSLFSILFLSNYLSSLSCSASGRRGSEAEQGPQQRARLPLNPDTRGGEAGAAVSRSGTDDASRRGTTYTARRKARGGPLGGVSSVISLPTRCEAVPTSAWRRGVWLNDDKGTGLVALHSTLNFDDGRLARSLDPAD
jgi:hypothetical protein